MLGSWGEKAQVFCQKGWRACNGWVSARQMPLSSRYVPTLDGLRALAILMVAWFHIWQQSWLMPNFTLGTRHISLSFLPRTGYLFVDLLVLLSGFCLFLPLARHLHEGQVHALEPTGVFFKKRFARIVPSYLLCIGVMLLLAISEKRYATFGDGALDVLAHLSFTHTWFYKTYWLTPLNGALWTLGIEVQFYLIFPLVAWCARKQPLVTVLGLLAGGVLFRAVVVGHSAKVWMLYNQLPAFLDVYALGLLGAMAYVALVEKRNSARTPIAWQAVASGVCILCVVLLVGFFKDLAGKAEAVSLYRWQAENRLAVGILFLGLVLASPFAIGAIRGLMANPAARFISAVSYNFYIWHQWLAVRFKQWRIPPYEGTQPNVEGIASWQWSYTILCFVLALVAAAALTWFFEKPIARMLLQKPKARTAPLGKEAGGQYSEGA